MRKGAGQLCVLVPLVPVGVPKLPSIGSSWLAEQLVGEWHRSRHIERQTAAPPPHTREVTHQMNREALLNLPLWTLVGPTAPIWRNRITLDSIKVLAYIAKLISLHEILGSTYVLTKKFRFRGAHSLVFRSNFLFFEEAGNSCQPFDIALRSSARAAETEPNSPGFCKFPAKFPGVHPKSETRKIRDSSP
jgi:hypothetical protein